MALQKLIGYNHFYYNMLVIQKLVRHTKRYFIKINNKNNIKLYIVDFINKDR